MDSSLIPLKETIMALRAELNSAVTEGEKEAIQFHVGPIELEFEVVVAREGGAGGKIGFRVLGAGAEVSADGKISGNRTQRIKLTLNPISYEPNVEKASSASAGVKLSEILDLPSPAGPGEGFEPTEIWRPAPGNPWRPVVVSPPAIREPFRPSKYSSKPNLDYLAMAQLDPSLLAVFRPNIPGGRKFWK